MTVECGETLNEGGEVARLEVQGSRILEAIRNNCPVRR